MIEQPWDPHESERRQQQILDKLREINGTLSFIASAVGLAAASAAGCILYGWFRS